MNLRTVESCGDVAAGFLFALLKERTPQQSISHKEMPSWGDHRYFVKNHPYKAWYLIEVDYAFVGAIYLTKQYEVGLFILNAHQGKGYGKSALFNLREMHPGRLLANINPNNEAGLAFWKGQGFKPLQVTYELEPY